MNTVDWTSRCEPISHFEWPPHVCTYVVIYIYIYIYISQFIVPKSVSWTKNSLSKSNLLQRTKLGIWCGYLWWVDWFLFPHERKVEGEGGGGVAYFSPETLWRSVRVIEKEIELHVFTTHQEWKTVTLFSRISQPPWIKSNTVYMYILPLYVTLIHVQNVSDQALMLDAKQWCRCNRGNN